MEEGGRDRKGKGVKSVGRFEENLKNDEDINRNEIQKQMSKGLRRNSNEKEIITNIHL